MTAPVAVFGKTSSIQLTGGREVYTLYMEGKDEQGPDFSCIELCVLRIALELAFCSRLLDARFSPRMHNGHRSRGRAERRVLPRLSSEVSRREKNLKVHAG